MAKLREPHGSVPGNPLLAEPMYLVGYIERMGTGTRDMIRRCRESGLPEPEFSIGDGFVTVIRRVAPAPPVTPPVTLLVRLLGEKGELGNAEIRRHLGLKDKAHFRKRYLHPSLEGGWVEMTLPDKPNSRLQTYRLTAQGSAMLKILNDATGG